MDQVTFRGLPAADQVRLKNSAAIAQWLENFWAAKISGALEDMVPEILENLERTGKPMIPDLERLFVEHFFNVSIRAMRHAMTEAEPSAAIPTEKITATLAYWPKIKIPKSLAELMRLYDLYRKGNYKPARQVQEAKRIQKAYLEKVASVWEKHSEAFRKGDVASQVEVVREVKEAARTTGSRAKNIVRTETTSYYNKARTQIYDESQDITHYLFIAIRDATTSPWCTPLTIKGYRGRSGLVYAKDDPLRDKERPSCHPGCRSELLPLNRLNPAHLKYIQDLSIQRRRHTCFPLLKGWRAA